MLGRRIFPPPFTPALPITSPWGKRGGEMKKVKASRGGTRCRRRAIWNLEWNTLAAAADGGPRGHGTGTRRDGDDHRVEWAGWMITPSPRSPTQHILSSSADAAQTEREGGGEEGRGRGGVAQSLAERERDEEEKVAGSASKDEKAHKHEAVHPHHCRRLLATVAPEGRRRGGGGQRKKAKLPISSSSGCPWG
ncbi:hypothetical protein niasHT_027157 [Heterodera trifolii]|uniref:Uncharacterized protein n=1 Tax=Heterodera trifolii TaxID=157864 RepID=A0ABD2JIR6_9BILA